jgi:hypothetical protein
MIVIGKPEERTHYYRVNGVGHAGSVSWNGTAMNAVASTDGLGTTDGYYFDADNHRLLIRVTTATSRSVSLGINDASLPAKLSLQHYNHAVRVVRHNGRLRLSGIDPRSVDRVVVYDNAGGWYWVSMLQILRIWAVSGRAPTGLVLTPVRGVRYTGQWLFSEQGDNCTAKKYHNQGKNPRK